MQLALLSFTIHEQYVVPTKHLRTHTLTPLRLWLKRQTSPHDKLVLTYSPKERQASSED